jgi:hypothetical protein
VPCWDASRLQWWVQEHPRVSVEFDEAADGDVRERVLGPCRSRLLAL